MSRYSATTKDGKDMAFGYDRPLQEYFLQVFDEDDELEFDLGSSGMSMCGPQLPPQSNSTIYKKIKELMSPQDFTKHKELLSDILMDLPI